MNTKQLKAKVLDLAIHGKLLSPETVAELKKSPDYETADVLLEKIRKEKEEKIAKGELKRDKKDSYIFVGDDKRHYEKFTDGTVKDIEDEIPFDIPEGWAWTKIHCVSSEILYGVSESAKETGKYKLLRITDIQDDQVNWDSVPFTDFPEEKVSNYILKNGDIVFARTGATVGKSYLIENLNIESIYASYLIRIRTSLLLNPRYMKYYFGSLTYWNQITDKSSGIGQPNVNGTSLANLYIPIPPYNEQERILPVIEKVFKLIDSLENDKDKLENLIKQAKNKILDLAIHGKLVPQDANDEPAEELLKRIATSDNRPYEKVVFSEIDWTLPNNWCLCHFGDISTVINGKNQSKVENPNGKYPIYGSGGIMGRADDYICPENCTIIGRKGSINNPIFVEEKFWNVDTAFGLSPSEAVLPRFLFYFCEYFDFTTLDSSTTLPSLTKTNIQQIIFALPPIEEQKRILDKTNELFRKLDEIVLNLI
ncbi:MAG: restriction endonuclease subunit S [Treponema sp.]|nr:restriction endonuclease subunit S [Treponema sp.]